MRNASARGHEMKATFNNNLPNQTNDVIVNPRNPENPDSKLFKGNIPNKQASPQSPMEIIRAK